MRRSSDLSDGEQQGGGPQDYLGILPFLSRSGPQPIWLLPSPARALLSCASLGPSPRARRRAASSSPSISQLPRAPRARPISAQRHRPPNRLVGLSPRRPGTTRHTPTLHLTHSLHALRRVRTRPA